jgi:hypothetical protein
VLRRVIRRLRNWYHGYSVTSKPVFNVGDLVRVSTRKFVSRASFNNVTSIGIVVRVVRGTDTIYEWMGDRWVYEVFMEGGTVVMRGEYGMEKL